MKPILFALSFCFSVNAAIIPIPRMVTKTYLTEGIFAGGKELPANLESIRVASHETFERWVIEFSDPKTKKLGEFLPTFQLQMIEGGKASSPESEAQYSKPYKMLLLLRNIHANQISDGELQKFVQKSAWIKKITTYPPVEQGDMAIEFIFKQAPQFQVHQPLNKEGRLVMDFKKSDIALPAEALPVPKKVTSEKPKSEDALKKIFDEVEIH